jgi:hypothetical protein
MRNVTEMKIKWEDTFFSWRDHIPRSWERKERGKKKPNRSQIIENNHTRASSIKTLLLAGAGDMILWCFWPPYHVSLRHLCLTHKHILPRFLMFFFLFLLFFKFYIFKRTKLTLIYTVFNAKTRIKGIKFWI